MPGDQQDGFEVGETWSASLCRLALSILLGSPSAEVQLPRLEGPKRAETWGFLARSREMQASSHEEDGYREK